MFRVFFAMKEIGTHNNLKDALRQFVKTTQDEIGKGGIALQVLETACWIEFPKSPPLMFYHIKTLAYDEGIINDKGEIIG